ncbi:MAG: type II secretion system F family protein [Pseudomonadota bacterium]
MIFAVLLFLVSLLLVGAAIVIMLRSGGDDKKKDALLRIRALGGDEVADLASPEADDNKIKNPILRWTCHILWRSGSEVEVETVQKILIGLGISIPLVLLIFGGFTGSFIIGVVLIVGFILLTRQAAARRQKIVGQLPDFLESTIRVLAAGNTLEESMASAARESAEPLRTLFLSISRQVRLGAPIENVLMETGRIHKLRDIRVMALAASVNRKYGGSLKNILRSLVQAIRSRDAAARELRALTAETRFSAVVLSTIPIALTLYILVVNRGYYVNMWADPSGRVMLIISMIMQLTGMVVIWRMMRSTEDAE